MIGDRSWSRSFTDDEPIVSFSQNAEDIRLWRIFQSVPDGFYVDVGAADPSISSVTRLFYEHGWSGINVEPSPTFEGLSADRTRDINLRVAVGTFEGAVPFFLTYPYLGMSTVDPANHAEAPGAIERIEKITVPQRRLDAILREHAGDRTVHFLKIDVEGAEFDVLASSDWSSFRPIVVVVEAVASCSTTTTHSAWEHLLLEAGYRYAAFDGINRFYVEEGYEQYIPTLAYPTSPLDHFVPALIHDLRGELDEKTATADDLRRSLDHAETELVRMRETLEAHQRSRSRRIGRLASGAAMQGRQLGRHLRRSAEWRGERR